MMNSLGTLGSLPLDVRRFIYDLEGTAMYLSRVSRSIRLESRNIFLVQSTAVPIGGKELYTHMQRSVVEMPPGMHEPLVVVPLTNPRDARHVCLKRGDDVGEMSSLQLVGEVVVTSGASLAVYSERRMERYVPHYGTRTYERVMRRQLETLIGRGLYCTLEDLVGCNLVPETLTTDPERPLSMEQKVEAERRILSHFQVDYSGQITYDEYRRIGQALEAGTPMPREGRMLAYETLGDVERVVLTLDVISMVCGTLGWEVRFTVVGIRGAWLARVEDRFNGAWAALATCVGVGDQDRHGLFWYSYPSTHDAGD